MLRLLLVCALVSPAAADEIVATAPAPHERTTTIAIDPLFLIIPMLDATVEVQPTKRIGIAGTAGIGHMFLPIGNMMYTLGGQANVYLQRDFSGPHLGVELQYIWGSSGGSTFYGLGPTVMESSVTERIAGIYAGWKWMSRRGFTAVLQYGIGRMNMRSTSDPPSSKIVPIGNGTIGWSF